MFLCGLQKLPLLHGCQLTGLKPCCMLLKRVKRRRVPPQTVEESVPQLLQPRKPRSMPRREAQRRCVNAGDESPSARLRCCHTSLSSRLSRVSPQHLFSPTSLQHSLRIRLREASTPFGCFRQPNALADFNSSSENLASI